MQGSERGEEQEEQRDDACETHEVKTAEAYLRERVPAAKRGAGDEEAGDGEKDLHSALTIPDEKFEWRGNVRGVGNAREKQAHVDVIHEDEKDGQAAEKIDAIETCQRRRSDWRGHEVIMRQVMGRSGGSGFFVTKMCCWCVVCLRWGSEERFLHHADRHLRRSEGEKKRRRSAPVEMTGLR